MWQTRKRAFFSVCGVGFVIVLLSGCGGPQLTISQMRANYAKMGSEAVIAAKRISSHLSERAGLGDTQSVVQSVFGKPSQVISPESMTYLHNAMTVQYTNGRVSSIQKAYAPAISLHSAQQDIYSMIPTDARQVFQVVHPSESGSPAQVVAEYTSASLATLYSSKIWRAPLYGQSGTIYVTITTTHASGQKVSSISLSMTSDAGI